MKHSNHYAFDRKSIWSTDITAIKKLLSEIDTQEALTVYLDPALPEQAVLNIEISRQRWSHAYALVISGLLLIVIGIFMKQYS